MYCYVLKGNLAHNFMSHCSLHFSSHLDISNPSKMRNTENIGIIQNCGRNTMKFANPPDSGFPNESLCEVIKLGIPCKRNLKFLWGKHNS